MRLKGDGSRKLRIHSYAHFSEAEPIRIINEMGSDERKVTMREL